MPDPKNPSRNPVFRRLHSPITPTNARQLKDALEQCAAQEDRIQTITGTLSPHIVQLKAELAERDGRIAKYEATLGRQQRTLRCAAAQASGWLYSALRDASAPSALRIAVCPAAKQLLVLLLAPLTRWSARASTTLVLP